MILIVISIISLARIVSLNVFKWDVNNDKLIHCIVQMADKRYV